MNRRFVDSGIVMIALALIASCSREQAKSPATATPAAKATAAAAAAGAAAPQAAAQPATPKPVEELYVDLEADPDEGPPPLTVKFTGSVEDASPPLTYKWDFGDGSPPSSEANPTHVYQKEGEFTATVTIKDSKGVSGSEEVDVAVEAE
jgi:PKD repeat protein